MHPVFTLMGKEIPAYGLMIVTGVLCANLIACLMLRQRKQALCDLIILEGYGFIAGFLGAKILYLIVSAKEIAWFRLSDAQYALSVLRGGFVFYGGLLGGLAGVFLAGRIHHIDVMRLLREVIFLVPLAHAFGRTGCFLAGCCYGCAYEGPLAVRYPAGGIAPHDVTLFPVQLAEAGALFVISAAGLYLQRTGRIEKTVQTYLGAYAVLRFALEYARADAARGALMGFSTSQWVSILLTVALTVWHLFCGRLSVRGEADQRSEYEIS